LPPPIELPPTSLPSFPTPSNQSSLAAPSRPSRRETRSSKASTRSISPVSTPKTEASAGRKIRFKTGAFAPNKKWAVSPLISPPAGEFTATQADKFVCILSIRRNARKFNAQVRRRGRFSQCSAAAEHPFLSEPARPMPLTRCAAPQTGRVGGPD
jgi:hypothetical protein